MKKFLSNTIVQLLIAVIIGLLAGFVVNDAVLEVVICIKHITGQIIFFLVPLIILGFIAPSIAHLRSNASKMLLFAFSIAYLSSIGASFIGAAVKFTKNRYSTGHECYDGPCTGSFDRTCYCLG